jgi:hypothetical protein
VFVALTAMRTESSTACRSAMIPAYLGPDAMWRLSDRPVPRRVVILNPSSGPGTEQEPSYRYAVGALRRSGTRVLGYVHTEYGARDASAVKADIERYRSWYDVDGVFLDETAETVAQVPYYAALSRHVRAAGRQLIALNPGVVPAREYFDVADVVVTFEGPFSEYAAAVRGMPEWLRRLPPQRSAHLVYGASREHALQAVDGASAGYFYATTGALPNPWRSIPGYLDDLEAQLEDCG